MADRDALDTALRWLGRQPYTVSRLRQRLEGAGFGPAEIETCLSRLLGWGYLDDRKFAAGRIAVLKRRLKSRAYTEQDLLAQGVEESLAPEVLSEEYPPEQEMEIIRALLARGGGADHPRNGKEYQRLLRAGFAEEVLRKTLPELSSP